MVKKVIALVLILCLSLSCVGCSSSSKVTGYEEVYTFGSESYLVAFRSGDTLRDIMTAGMLALAYDGTLAQYSVKWFGADNKITLKGTTDAAAWLENQPTRTFILGYYKDSAPLCFENAGVITGFDADMFTEICARLGWTIKFQEIAYGTAAAQLASGNVDAVAGGFSTADDASKLSVSPTYMNFKYTVITKTVHNISKKSKLEGKILGTVTGSTVATEIEADTDLVESLASIKVLNSYAECFTALDTYICDAIAITSTAADYYMG